MKDRLVTLFQSTFETPPHETYVSPGRVNIIGGHTDYNGGHVLPFCIDKGIYVAVGFRNDNLVRVYSEQFKEKGIIEFDLDHLDYEPSRSYANYVSGSIKMLQESGKLVTQGMNLVFLSDLPTGGGLSSSAAFLVAVITICNDRFQFGLSGQEIATLARKVENEYIGVSCGIMDQFIIANGLENHVMYLNAKTLEYEQIPVTLDQYTFVLINSNVTRTLIESKYNVRQKESLALLDVLQYHTDINSVCDVTPNQYFELYPLIDDETLQKRFSHLVFENDRVSQAKEALLNNDFIRLGELLDIAHASAKELFEISSTILDQLVVLAKRAGSIGSKMIGGGFGGSILNIVETKKLDEFRRRFRKYHLEQFQREPIMDTVKIKAGVHKI